MVSCCRLHQTINYDSLEKYLRLTFTQPLILNCTTNAGVLKEGDGRARAEFGVMITLYYKSRYFKLNHTTDFSSYRGDGKTPAVFLSSSLLGYVLRESIDIDEN